MASPDVESAPVVDRPGGTARVVLDVRDIEVEYGGSVAVHGVSLSVAPGEIVGLIGPNGAGKSSLLNAIAGDLRPRAGSVLLGNENVTDLPAYKRARRGMGRTSQTARVYEGLTVFEGLVTSVRGNAGASLLATVSAGRRRDAEAIAAQRAWAVLDQFGLQHIANNFGRELSGGQRRFVDLAMALVRDPDVLLLDEPMVGLAPVLVPDLLKEVKAVAAQGTGMLIVEHALDIIATLCDRVVVMAAGAVIANGTYEQIVDDVDVRRAYLN